MAERADLLVCGASAVVTPAGSSALAGAALGRVRVLPGAGVAIRGERVLAVAPEAELRARHTFSHEIHARGGAVVPGFVDAHTHPVFHGTREDEFELRTAGKTYVEIASQGGGILSSVRGVRRASKELLLSELLGRLDRFLELGTTTIEAKSGYGLSVADELKCLEVLQEAARVHPVEIVPTFLGAHALPAEFRDRRGDYVDLVVQEMLPRVAAGRLAEYCDVFTETHAFSREETRRILLAARAQGLGARLHVDQLSPLGGAELAAELGAASADHLEHVSDAGIDALARAGVIPVLCPTVPLYLRQEREAPARRMIQAGLAPALATDFNPGSSYGQSMPETLTCAALRFRLSAEECLTAATLNGAASLGRADRLGSIEPEKQADLLILDAPNHRFLVYEFGWNPVRVVIKKGRVVRERPARG
jgi:imidazolonepropionase